LRCQRKQSRKFSASKCCGRELPSANYREASRGRSKAEFIAKVGDCLKEADETAYWLELLSDEEIVSKQRLEPLLKETNELISILVTISKRARGD
jgi:four helix bundle protein